MKDKPKEMRRKMKEIKARYSICTIITTDKDILTRSVEFRKRGFTHENIYVAGITKLEGENV